MKDGDGSTGMAEQPHSLGEGPYDPNPIAA